MKSRSDKSCCFPVLVVSRQSQSVIDDVWESASSILIGLFKADFYPNRSHKNSSMNFFFRKIWMEAAPCNFSLQ